MHPTSLKDDGQRETKPPKTSSTSRRPRQHPQACTRTLLLLNKLQRKLEARGPNGSHDLQGSSMPTFVPGFGTSDSNYQTRILTQGLVWEGTFLSHSNHIPATEIASLWHISTQLAPFACVSWETKFMPQCCSLFQHMHLSTPNP